MDLNSVIDAVFGLDPLEISLISPDANFSQELDFLLNLPVHTDSDKLDYLSIGVDESAYGVEL